MRDRHLPKLALAVVTLAACSAPDRRSPNDTSASHASADTTLTMQAMIEALGRDRNESERQLSAAEDSLYVFMGDTMAVLLKQARTSWEQYRKLECDAIGVAYAEGSMAPIAQLECWIDLTDGHRKFLARQYDYMRNGGPPSRPRPR